MKIVRVALDVPLPKLFDYACEEAGERDVGRRIVVPLGNRSLAGVIVAVSAETDVPVEKLRAAGAILDDMPPLSRDWLDLARFAAEYYQRPLGEVVHAALPPRLRRPRPLRLAAAAYALTEAGRAALSTLSPRARAQRALLERLTSDPAPPASLGSAGALRTAIRAGWVAAVPAPRAPIRFVAEHALIAAQAAAVAAITAALDRYQAFLLAGVTGSGKTEVYLHCVAEALARGRQALLLVPEINLTPHLAETLARRFPGARIVTLTNALAANERAEAWLAAHTGGADVVLGTRLAVFAPLPRLGLVVVDEEHDASFKQQEGVRYGGRGARYSAGSPRSIRTRRRRAPAHSRGGSGTRATARRDRGASGSR